MLYGAWFRSAFMHLAGELCCCVFLAEYVCFVWRKRCDRVFGLVDTVGAAQRAQTHLTHEAPQLRRYRQLSLLYPMMCGTV